MNTSPPLSPPAVLPLSVGRFASCLLCKPTLDWAATQDSQIAVDGGEAPCRLSSHRPFFFTSPRCAGKKDCHFSFSLWKTLLPQGTSRQKETEKGRLAHEHFSLPCPRQLLSPVCGPVRLLFAVRTHPRLSSDTGQPKRRGWQGGSPAILLYRPSFSKPSEHPEEVALFSPRGKPCCRGEKMVRGANEKEKVALYMGAFPPQRVPYCPSTSSARSQRATMAPSVEQQPKTPS